MADTPTDVKAPVVEQETTTPAPSAEETKAPEVAEDQAVLDVLKDDSDESTTENKPEPKSPKPETDKPKEVPAEQDKKPEEVENPKPEDTKGEDKPLGKAESRKEQLNAEIRDLVAQRNEIRKEVEKTTSEVYQPASEEELREQGMTPEMAAIEAMKQERETERYNTQVAETHLTLTTQVSRVLQDFPMFNPEDKEHYREGPAQEAYQLLEQSLIRDPNVPEIDPETGEPTGKGLVIGSNVEPYALYQTIARAAGESAAAGQIRGQQETEQMLANADDAGSSSPPKKEVDPILAILKSDDD